MRLANALIIIAWTIFFAFWIWKWRESKATRRHHNRAAYAAYMVPTILGVFLIEFGWRKAAPATPLGIGLWRPSLFSQWGALAIVYAGLAIALSARVALAANWSAQVVVKEGHELTTSGPYAWVRHPIYTGMLLMFLGSALAVGTGAAFLGLALVTVGFIIKLRQEEALMRDQFAGAYLDYERRVKRLIPFIW